MPALTDRKSDTFVKLLWLGNSGVGKTGGLAPLALAGYQLRVLDFDNGLDALANIIRAAKPAALANVSYESIRDSYVASPLGPIIRGSPRAFVSAIKLLDKWSDATVPADWGPNHVLVIDSLTNLSRAAFAWAVALNPGSKEPRQWYSGAQKAIEDVLAILTAEDFHANVIVISHVETIRQTDGTDKGFPTSIGKALAPKIARFFNNMVLTESTGQGASVRRSIRTMPTAFIDLKNAAPPAKMSVTYPLETGILDIFNLLKSE